MLQYAVADTIRIRLHPFFSQSVCAAAFLHASAQSSIDIHTADCTAAAVLATHAADVLQHFESVHGIRMQSLSPFNEPASPAWCLQLNNRQEGCYFSKPRSHKVTAGRSHICSA
jgi:hypothetical protein